MITLNHFGEVGITSRIPVKFDEKFYQKKNDFLTY